MTLRLRWVFLALFATCLGISFAPGFPIHGYGHIWWALPLLYWFREPRQRRRLLLYVLGIALQVLAYPDFDFGFLGWVLLLPYLRAREQEDGAPWFRTALLYGFLRSHVGFFWLGHIHFVAWLSVSIVTALAFALCFEGVMRKLRFLPYALRVATALVFFEAVHATMFGGLPWLFLAHTQYAYTRVIQVADLVGVFGLGFVMAFAQGAIYACARGRGRLAAGIAALLVAGVLLYGGGQRAAPAEEAGEPSDPSEHGRPLLLVQTNYTHSVKVSDDLTLESLLEKLYTLTMAGLREHPEAELVVWPETMFPYPYVEGAVKDHFDFRQTLRLLAAQIGRPTIYGINSFTSREKVDRLRGYNAMLLADRKGEIAGIYRKQRLVPMGEEFLLRRLLPEEWCDSVMAWLVRHLHYPESCDLESGEGFAILDAGPGLRCAPLICLEGVYPDLARNVLKAGGADFILHLMNNGWFGPFEQRQGLANWVFRAVETRMPFVSCANVGQSCLISPQGAILARLEPVPAEGFLLVRVPPPGPPPPFGRGGSWRFGLIPPFLALLFALGALWRRQGRVPLGSS